MPASGPLMTAPSVNVVPPSTTLISWRMYRQPRELRLLTQPRGGSILVTVWVVVGPPLALAVIFAPTTKSPSMPAFWMTPPATQVG